MIDRNSAATALAARSCIGPLFCYFDGFAALLRCQEYTQKAVRHKCLLVRHLSRWLEGRGLALERLDEEQLDGFLLDRHHRGKPRAGEIRTAHQILGYLRDLGCTPPRSRRVVSTPLTDLLAGFEKFLSEQRGLAPATLTNYLPIVRRFLIERFGNGSLDCCQLRASDIHHFILESLPGGRAKLRVTVLRSFLRYLQQCGTISTDLAAAVPGAAYWKLSNLPKTIPPADVELLLASCDRDTPTGRRDYAILLLLARLGLRCGEVVAMTLDDLDWDCGEIVVRGKGQRLARLPLLADVGAASVNYLHYDRPACSTRRVFVRIYAPHTGWLGTSPVRAVVYSALARAGLNPVFKGSHLLRHSLATDLLRRGASLLEIGQVLRHSQPATTQIYAKVDIAALRQIGQPWPGIPS
jgi:site-specific recombinase XerD